MSLDKNYKWFDLSPNISKLKLKGRKNQKYLEVTFKLSPEQFLKNPQNVDTIQGFPLWVIKFKEGEADDKE